MFIALTITYIFIILIALYGDYKSKELEKQKEEWEKIIGRKYD